MSFFRELKERNVFKVAFIYTVTGWLLAQVAGLALPTFNAPEWVLQVFLFFLLLGFPVALIMAWALELTPEGIKRAEVSVGEKRMWLIAAVFMVGAISWFELGMSPAETPAHAEQVASAETVQPPAVAEDGVSIAVLPFIDLSPEKDQEYFALGMSEELLNVLAKIQEMSVTSRTSSFVYQDSELGAQAIGRELGVSHVLEGSIRKAGMQLRITAQLIDTRTDRHLWSETYDRSLEDVFSIQDEIATAIVAELRESLGIASPASAVSVAASTENIDAYTLYLEARELFRVRRVRDALASLEQAVALDPNFARGWELLSAAYAVAPGWLGNDRNYLALASEAAGRALAMNPELALAHASLGNVAMSLEDPDLLGAIEHFERALELDPNDETTHSWLAIIWQSAGYLDRAEASHRRCLEINPGYINCSRNLAAAYTMLGEQEKGLALYEDALARSPIGTNGEITQIKPLREQGQRTASLLLGYFILDHLRIDFDNWEQLVLTDRDEHPAERAALREALLGVHENEHVILHALANYYLLAIGYPEDIKVGVYDYLWIFLQYPAYRQSGRMVADIKAMNLPPVWEKYGPPPFCRKVNENYVCEAP